MSEPVVRNGNLHNICPVDLRPLPPLAVNTPEEIRRAVEKARFAQAEWSRLEFRERLKRLRQGARRMLERRQEALELLHDEVGKTVAEGLMTEAIGPLQLLNDCARVVKPYLRSRRVPLPKLAFPGKQGRTELVPRGVVGIIAPWNYPLAYFFKPVFPALLCGNGVVLKPSEYSPRSALWFTEVFSEFLPEGLLGCVLGGPEAGQELIASPIDALTFTGSYASGRAVARLAAERMIPLSAELGGKDAAIVLADCDLERTVGGILQWGFHNAGQACGAIDRVFVEEAIADRFADKLGAAASRLRVARPGEAGGDLGPLAHPTQLDCVESLIADAVAQGARVLCGGKRTGSGLSFEATVLDLCTPAMRIAQEPSFGPVLPIIRVRDAEEALRLANDCSYGLCGSVWSGVLERAEGLASRLDVGTAFINNHSFTGGVAAAPWTGVKQTGYGIANSEFGLGHFTRPRTQVVDRSKGPELYWFPLTPLLEELAHALAEAQLGKLGAIARLPGLISRRKRELKRGEPAPRALEPLPRRQRPASSPRMPFFAFERAWARLLFDTIFSCDPRDVGALPPLGPGEVEAVFVSFMKVVPRLTRLGVRVALWVGVLCPLFVGPRRRPLTRLAPGERVEALSRLCKSNSFVVRQIIFALKAAGAFTHLSTTRVLASAERIREPAGKAAAAIAAATLAATQAESRSDDVPLPHPLHTPPPPRAEL